MEVVCIKKLLPPNWPIGMCLHCVKSLLWFVPTMSTLTYIDPGTFLIPICALFHCCPVIVIFTEFFFIIFIFYYSKTYKYMKKKKTEKALSLKGSKMNENWFWTLCKRLNLNKFWIQSCYEVHSISICFNCSHIFF